MLPLVYYLFTNRYFSYSTHTGADVIVGNSSEFRFVVSDAGIFQDYYDIVVSSETLLTDVGCDAD